MIPVIWALKRTAGKTSTIVCIIGGLLANPTYITNFISSETLDVMKPFLTDAEVQDLLRKASEARLLAYCPYSKFQVGACLLCEDGSTYKGCNIENVTFTVGLCAERTAYVKAISEGKKVFRAVAVVAFEKDDFTSPCGACRQFMSEFGYVDVYLSKPDLKDVLVTSLTELLPLAFNGNYQKFRTEICRDDKSHTKKFCSMILRLLTF